MITKQSAEKDQISAQVNLTPSGAAHAAEVRQALESAGFTVGQLLANNFSITSNAGKLEDYFKVSLDASGVKGASGEAAYQLPLEALPPALRGKIDRIVFTHVDFGLGAG